MKRTLPISLSLALAAALSSASAQGVPSADARSTTALPTVPAEQAATEAVRAEMQATVGRLIDGGTFGAQKPESISMKIDLPAERVVNVGLLVDPRAASDEGVAVLGTVPGGDAQAIGVRAGDLIRAINGHSLVALGRDASGASEAVTALKREIDSLEDGDRLVVDVVRDGSAKKLTGAIAADFIPAMRIDIGEPALVASNAPVALSRTAAGIAAAQPGDCGRISTFHTAPRAQRLYRARVLNIDGKIPGPADQDVYRVSAGPHVLEVAEIIDSQDLPVARSRQRRDTEHTLEIDVKPNTTYTIAAHLIDPNARDFAHGGYWEPVVWKESTEGCR